MLETYGSPEKAIETLKKNLSTNPIHSRLDMQVLLNALGREEESFEVSNQLMKIAPEDPRVLFNHGWHWLKRGELQKGLFYLEYGRQLGTYGHKPLPSSQPLWAPETGRGHRVHLVLEGGFGDEMIHLRFGRDLVERHDCKVTVICHPKLADLVARLPWVSAVAQREAALGIYHDSWLPGMSAALALGLEFKDIQGTPYFKAHPPLVKQWGGLINRGGNRLKVGIRWSGNPQFEHQQLRLFPPELLIGLREIPGIQLYSFQRDNDLRELPEDIVDLGPHLKSWDDTAAALSQMDLMISSCTSVAHLSAALGRPTWVVVPALPYFVWAIPGRTSPWYDSVRLFRQAVFGSWDNVDRDLRRELLEWIGQHASAPARP